MTCIPRRGRNTGRTLRRARQPGAERARCLLLLLAALPCAATNARTAEMGPLPPLAVTQIADGVYVAGGRHEIVSPGNRGHIANLGFIVGEEAVAVIDTGGSLQVGLALKAAIRRLTGLPIKYVINSHAHPDHLLGNAAFSGEGAAFLGRDRLARALGAKGEHYLQATRALLGEDAFAGTQLVPPGRAVHERTELDLGGRVVTLKAWPTAHTDTDLTVFDGRTRTLFLGDLLFVRHIPVIDGSVRGWLQVMPDLAAIGAQRAVPGHGPASVPWPAAAAAQTRYLEALVRAVGRAIEQGRRLAEAVRDIPADAADDWLLVEQHHKRNVTAAFAELEWE